MSVVELSPQDFAAKQFGDFFQVATAEAGVVLNEPHFLQTWQTWMEMGFARFWWNDGCALGAVFTEDIFSKKFRAQVVFWLARPEVRHGSVTGPVFRAFEAAAREAGCSDIQAAAHCALDPSRRESGYMKNGFQKAELIFQKDLK